MIFTSKNHFDWTKFIKKSNVLKSFLTRDEVSDILLSQPNNTDKTKKYLSDKWLVSEKYTLMEVPIDSIGIASEVIGESKTEGPIIIEDNINYVGRYLGLYGSAPDMLVVDGKHRVAEEKIEVGKQ